MTRTRRAVTLSPSPPRHPAAAPAPVKEGGFITLVKEAAPASLSILQIISINDLAAAAGVRTIFVNKGSKSSVLYQHPPLVTTDPSTSRDARSED